VDCQLRTVCPHDGDDLQQLRIMGRPEIEAGVVVLIVEACVVACSMSSSEMPCLRADEWISTKQL